MLYEKGDPYDYRDARFQPPEDPPVHCAECEARLDDCDVAEWDMDGNALCHNCDANRETV